MAQILSYLEDKYLSILNTDVSENSIGVVLSQVQVDPEVITGYFCKSLDKADIIYCATRNELLPIVKSIVHCYLILYGRKIRIGPNIMFYSAF